MGQEINKIEQGINEIVKKYYDVRQLSAVTGPEAIQDVWLCLEAIVVLRARIKVLEERLDGTT